MKAFAVIMIVVAVLGILVTGAIETVRPSKAPAKTAGRNYSFTADMICKEM